MAVKLNRLVPTKHAHRQLIKAETACSMTAATRRRQNPVWRPKESRPYASRLQRLAHRHLGVNDEKHEDTKERYQFPYGDFTDVHRSGVPAAESRAGQYGHRDIELAAAHLLGMLEETR